MKANRLGLRRHSRTGGQRSTAFFSCFEHNNNRWCLLTYVNPPTQTEDRVACPRSFHFRSDSSFDRCGDDWRSRYCKLKMRQCPLGDSTEEPEECILSKESSLDACSQADKAYGRCRRCPRLQEGDPLLPAPPSHLRHPGPSLPRSHMCVWSLLLHNSPGELCSTGFAECMGLAGEGRWHRQ